MTLRTTIGGVVAILMAGGTAVALEIGAPLPSGSVQMKNVDGRELSLAWLELPPA